MSSKLVAIVPAAGVGARAQAARSGGAVLAPKTMPKQYRMLKGEPMLRRSVRALLADSRIAQVRVAVAQGDPWVAQALSGLPRTVWRACGGPTRAQTVLSALRDAALDAGDWVLVHDAARPGLPPSALERLIDTCLAHGAGGLLAQQVADTVKRARDADAGEAKAPQVVQASVPRDALWLAQTPQMFPAGLLLGALEAAGTALSQLTDEASALERAGYAPCLVPGSVRNFKVTWPEDFVLMEKWL
ncbi:2-C-methyl-D-erythritol 4-phosphate cytidylyltransferase [Allopusillimonas soli]|uniref:2-C-methyl-D-erythritol 4-phosphate cytidylyltransferase n=1 Tax=Allopusillimonas soli TaxID=659016 RepID=A0A853FBW7_9BURK|nr:2-C-methyl-D-erythritol 4-phosphate cytidylyltransferase [Allopusillimonas soli]NYT38275.1 2-C-methyl-D-erythritol 4-phosphate cytidylyltransferase [Allopusillimonas soli]TEA72150.1 2-C-methyl-D-erythritol 4-phosphate cytidylyltransferase [Allopusillimonas soli]